MGLSPYWSMSVLGMMAGMLLGLARSATSAPTGSWRSITTVWGSGATTAFTLGATVCPRAASRIHRVSEATTSAEVMAAPLWNTTSVRRGMVSRVFSRDHWAPREERLGLPGAVQGEEGLVDLLGHLLGDDRGGLVDVHGGRVADGGHTQRPAPHGLFGSRPAFLRDEARDRAPGQGGRSRPREKLPPRELPVVRHSHTSSRLLAPDHEIRRSRGSSTSRRPSPKRLRPRTHTMMASPGKRVIQGAWAMKGRPSLSSFPQDGM